MLWGIAVGCGCPVVSGAQCLNFSSPPILGSELRIPAGSDHTYAAFVCKGAR